MTKPPPPIKHLRVREESILGGTMYKAICGASGISGRDFAKELSKVGCEKCKAALEKIQKGKA